MPPKKYTHLSQRNQILKRPAQHIGSTKKAAKNTWLVETSVTHDVADNVAENTIDRIVQQEVEYVPGLLHIFYEVLSNAQDNYFHSVTTEHPLKKIEVTVDQATGEISVWNDGCWIQNTIHKWSADEEVIDDKPHYEAEIIFGHLNSSSNYNDDEQQRSGGGLHGVGVKLTNIFSKVFKVECFDPDTGIRFRQEYNNSMSDVKPPNITTLKQKKGYTKVSYIADFALFGVDGYTETDLQIIRKMCFDCAMITGQKVVFNGTPIPVKSLAAYAACYTDTNSIEFKSDDSSVVLCEKPAFEPGLVQISFVNGISTERGGVHLNAWKKAIFTPLLEKLKTKFTPKGKQSTPFKMTAKTLENYFMIFVNCNLLNPEFEGQTKSILTSPTPTVNVPPSKITALMKWDFVKEVEETIRVQGIKELSKTDGKKSAKVNIAGADDANLAGKAKSKDCTLMIVEGLSAKTFVVTGISAVPNGTDWYGILPVRGKVLNVRDAGVDQINNNKEITNIKTMLGLRAGLDYTKEENYKTLRYGRVVILTDADFDGNHIKGLIINFFMYFYPSLVTRGYLWNIRTPIVKATIGKRTISFYHLLEFKTWAAKQKTNFSAKYYKGLGTSTDAEIIEIFEDPKNAAYVLDNVANETVDMAFSKKRANDRKRWLEEYQERDISYEIDENGDEIVPISDFIHNELRTFSIYDNKRSIPSVIDGLKTVQRKALWGGLKKLSLTTDYKVAQFAGDVAKISEYHHGEISMQEAIIGMAQTFVGSNNISLFYESGQYGTRLSGGRDAAAGRYIFTRLQTITRYIFRKEDDPILEYLEEEGSSIEPKFYVPVIPMLLVNGSNGIGTGYSTDIPCFNPLDLVRWIRAWLTHGDCSDKDNAEQFPELMPWYRGFNGHTTQESATKFVHYGTVEQVDDYYHITELPIRIWTDDYKDLLNTLQSGVPAKETKTGYDALTVAQLKAELGERELTMSGTKKVLIDRLKAYDKENGTTVKKSATVGQLVSKWENHSDAYTVDFKVWTKGDVSLDYENPKFKLTTVDNLTNMTAFTPTGALKKYQTLVEILNTFCNVRFDFYKKRKEQLLAKLQVDLLVAETKARFVAAVLNDFELLRQTEVQLFQWLAAEKYYAKDGSYRYLTDMPIRTINTPNKCESLAKEIADLTAEIEYVTKLEEKSMWITELEEFVTAYEEWKTKLESVNKKIPKKRFLEKSAQKAASSGKRGKKKV